MKNYISINGKQTELTNEQLEQLGIVVEKPKPKNPFARVEDGDNYYAIGQYGQVIKNIDFLTSDDDILYEIANYFNDINICKQEVLRLEIYRMLKRFSYDNGWSEDLWEDGILPKYKIYLDRRSKCFLVDRKTVWKEQSVYFKTEEIANKAIEKILKPFIEKHPEFRW